MVASRAAPMSTEVSRGPRIDSIDLLRGLIIIVMALDHSRDFFGDFAASPTDLATTTPALFFTGWITHICAPVFFLLTGVGTALPPRLRGMKFGSSATRHTCSRGLAAGS
jgi:uncharacterized membrane protein